ncbi:MAG: (5-formylfuran-3-yl)methyl phosphate synthase, partial [Gemmatimonadota bacterium]
MRLLVSVRDAGEVGAATWGGAEVLDVKDPARGPLGAPSLSVLRAVRTAAPAGLPVSVALGDAGAASDALCRSARAAAACGVTFLKVALRGEVRRAGAWLRELVDSVGDTHPDTRVVAVAYADVLSSDRASLLAIPAIAAAAGAYAVMLDTAKKDGRTLLDHLQDRALARWIEAAHAAGLSAGCAGSLGVREIARIRDLGPDVVGVRGAACRGGRTGRL